VGGFHYCYERDRGVSTTTTEILLGGGFALPSASYAAPSLRAEDDTMLTSTPFLLFDGDCAEAMTFYQAGLGGELTLTRLGDTPMKDQFPAEKHDRIINAHLSSGAITISATDWMASPEFDPVLGNRFAIFITGSADELRTPFDKLKDGTNNTHLQELHDMPFGVYGQFYDRFGTQWIFRGDLAQ
jgi:PhnB protein